MRLRLIRDATLFTERGIIVNFWSVALPLFQRNLAAKNRVKHKTLNQIGKHRPDIILVHFFDERLMGQSPFLFGSFFGQDMALVRLFALDLTGTGNFKPLLRS
jgi:hypothetical protein